MLMSPVEAVVDFPVLNIAVNRAGTEGQSRWRRFVKSFSGPSDSVDRRRDRRYPYSQSITLYPVNPDLSPCEGGPLLVAGKSISEGGLSFYHTSALPYRRVIADLEAPGGARLAVLVDLTWCRFTCHGRYENGGRFLQVVEVGDDGKDGSSGECELDLSEPCF